VDQVAGVDTTLELLHKSVEHQPKLLEVMLVTDRLAEARLMANHSHFRQPVVVAQAPWVGRLLLPPELLVLAGLGVHLVHLEL
jgi:hypothetical protein